VPLRPWSRARARAWACRVPEYQSYRSPPLPDARPYVRDTAKHFVPPRVYIPHRLESRHARGGAARFGVSEYLTMDEKLRARLWLKVDREDCPEHPYQPELGRCWLWSGALSEGYGGMVVDGVRRQAHRLSYEAYVGPIPDGEVIRHTCDRRSCINPDHLLPGTQLQNMDDLNIRERGTHKLTASQVQEIRVRRAVGRLTFERLGREYGVSGATVRAAVVRQTWRHV
jgi:hypothetical protein